MSDKRQIGSASEAHTYMLRNRRNVLILTEGPKKGQVYMVPVPGYKRKLQLRRARWLLCNTAYERALGFIMGYRAGVSEHPWTKLGPASEGCEPEET